MCVCVSIEQWIHYPLITSVHWPSVFNHKFMNTFTYQIIFGGCRWWNILRTARTHIAHTHRYWNPIHRRSNDASVNWVDQQITRTHFNSMRNIIILHKTRLFCGKSGINLLFESAVTAVTATAAAAAAAAMAVVSFSLKNQNITRVYGNKNKNKWNQILDLMRRLIWCAPFRHFHYYKFLRLRQRISEFFFFATRFPFEAGAADAQYGQRERSVLIFFIFFFVDFPFCLSFFDNNNSFIVGWKTINKLLSVCRLTSWVRVTYTRRPHIKSFSIWRLTTNENGRHNAKYRQFVSKGWEGGESNWVRGISINALWIWILDRPGLALDSIQIYMQLKIVKANRWLVSPEKKWIHLYELRAPCMPCHARFYLWLKWFLLF